MNNLYLLIGPSGSGKSTLEHGLNELYGSKPLLSYTTRPKRREDEGGHIFLTQEAFDAKKAEGFVAYTKYNGYEYGVTKDLLMQSDFYVIDPAGALELILNPEWSDRPIYIFWMEVDQIERRKRMRQRGDDELTIEARIRNDAEAFSPRIKYMLFTKLPPSKKGHSRFTQLPAALSEDRLLEVCKAIIDIEEGLWPC